MRNSALKMQIQPAHCSTYCFKLVVYQTAPFHAKIQQIFLVSIAPSPDHTPTEKGPTPPHPFTLAHR